jgi:hypothetical protein
MQAIKFPVPNRSEYIPSPYEPDADGGSTEEDDEDSVK